MPPAPTRRLLLALAASLGLHALLWLVADRRSPPSSALTPAPPAASPAQLELVEVDVEVAPARTPPPAPPRTPRPPRKRPAAPGRVAEVPSEPPPSEGSFAPPPVPDPPRADAPRADAPRADLRPSLSLALPTPHLSTSMEEPTSMPDAGVPTPEQRMQQLVQQMVEESIGRGKVERGLAHSYYSELGKALLKNWDAERAVSAQGLPGFLEQAGQSARDGLRIWQGQAEDFGRSGTLLGAREEGTTTPYDMSLGDPNLAARRALARQMREQFQSSRRATLRVVQDAQGRLLSVELVNPSNNGEVDRQALVDVRAAAERLPTPPPEAVGGRDRLVSLWEFELIISISPPIPMVAFEFDVALKHFDARLPLDRRIYKRVRLVAVQ